MANLQLRACKVAIRAYLQNLYTDEKIAALLAHAQDGKLSYHSCDCLIGAATTKRALKWGVFIGPAPEYLLLARQLDVWGAETGFLQLGFLNGKNFEGDEMLYRLDVRRRARVIPIIRAEIRRRDRLKARAGEMAQVASA